MADDGVPDCSTLSTHVNAGLPPRTETPLQPGVSTPLGIGLWTITMAWDFELLTFFCAASLTAANHPDVSWRSQRKPTETI